VNSLRKIPLREFEGCTLFIYVMSSFDMPDRLLKSSEVAKILDVSESTLARWRGKNSSGGPPFIKLGKGKYSRVRYLPLTVSNTTEAE